MGVEELAAPLAVPLEKGGLGQGLPKTHAVPSQALRASEYGGRQGRKRRAGVQPDLSQALCPGDSPLHKDLPGELVVHELFSSVLQEICDEVSEGQVGQAGGQGETG